jgi:hypothetical protein
MKDNFAEYINLGCQLFSFSDYKIPLRALLALTVCVEKYNVILMDLP